MLDITRVAPDRIDLELTAVLDGDMMATALDALIEEAADIQDGKMLYTISSFSMPTGGAFVAEMVRLPQLLGLIRHFSRCAVLTDVGWIKTAAELEGKMFPGLTIKSFDLDDVAAANAWLDAPDDSDDPNVPV